MKKIVNISLSGKSFSMDEDAYRGLKQYLSAFKSKVSKEVQWKEVMDDIERRISELFTEKLGGGYKDVVNISMVNEIIMQLGMPDGSEYTINLNQQLKIKKIKAIATLQRVCIRSQAVDRHFCAL